MAKRGQHREAGPSEIPIASGCARTFVKDLFHNDKKEVKTHCPRRPGPPMVPAFNSRVFALHLGNLILAHELLEGPSGPMSFTDKLDRKTQKRLLKLQSKLVAWRDDSGSYLLAIASIVGLAMGVTSALFRWMIIKSHDFFHIEANSLFGMRESVPESFETVIHALLPAIGGLLVGLLIYKVLHLAGGHGVPSVMKAVATGQVNLSPSMAIKSMTSPVTITTGGSAGPEGPIIEIGSVVGSWLGSVTKVRKDHMGTLIGCGAASGIAAVFNAPMGGVVFALELIMRDFHVRKFAPVVISAVIAAVTSSALLPNNPAFVRPSDNILETIQPSLFLVVQFGILGLACAGVGALLTTMIYWMHDRFHQLKVPMWIKPTIGGLLVGLIGLKVPGILGEGYETVNSVILGAGTLNQAIGMVLLNMLLICVLKVLATSLTLSSGGTGGSFAPAMVAGAFVGGAVGILAEQIMPTLAPDYRIFAMVGMAGVVSSALGTPMAAMLIIYEVCGGRYTLVLPLMITVAVSSVITGRMRKGSVYTLSLLRDGFDVEESHAQRRDPLETIPIEEIMTSSFVSIRPHDPLNRIMEILSETDVDAFIVSNEKGELCGVISTSDLRSVVNIGDIGSIAVIAQDIADSNPPVLYPTTTANRALEIFSSTDIEGIPILKDTSTPVIVGIVYRGAVLRAYRQAAISAKT